MTKRIKWRRANDGFVESYDGRWQIQPLYWGCVNPQSFDLYLDGKVVSRMNSTQREAKQEAERLRAPRGLAGFAEAVESAAKKRSA